MPHGLDPIDHWSCVTRGLGVPRGCPGICILGPFDTDRGACAPGRRWLGLPKSGANRARTVVSRVRRSETRTLSVRSMASARNVSSAIHSVRETRDNEAYPHPNREHEALVSHIVAHLEMLQARERRTRALGGACASQAALRTWRVPRERAMAVKRSMG